MKIDLRGGSHKQDGFGVAGRSIYDALEGLGHEITENGDIALVFSHPDNFVADAEYNIGYFPWESTAPKPGWVRHMRKMDEIWVTSPVMADYVLDWGFDTHVYQHGVSPDWTPQKREVDGKMHFLHQGLEAYRKGGHMMLSAFGAAFRGNNDVSLTMKTGPTGAMISFGKVTVNTEVLPRNDLKQMYYDHHVMVAPSYGEGFGLPALDALGTGMPTIMTSGVFPHEEFSNRNMLIKSNMAPGPDNWVNRDGSLTHPGLVWHPDFDDLVDRLRWVYENYEAESGFAFEKAKKIHKVATWEARTEKVFNDLAIRINQ